MDPRLTVRFNKPYVMGRELPYIQEAIENAHLAGTGRSPPLLDITSAGEQILEWPSVGCGPRRRDRLSGSTST
jgi:hypothetical protein